MEYQFTECDSLDGRWRVAVAKKPNECETDEVPVRQKQCCEYLYGSGLFHSRGSAKESISGPIDRDN